MVREDPGMNVSRLIRSLLLSSAVLLLPVGSLCSADETGIAERRALGERLYREGILPNVAFETEYEPPPVG